MHRDAAAQPINPRDYGITPDTGRAFVEEWARVVADAAEQGRPILIEPGRYAIPDRGHYPCWLP